MFKSLMFLFLIITFSSFVNATVYINEILANPEGSDSYAKEFIELYSNELDVNFSNWKINDSNSEGDLLDLNFSDNFLVLNGNDYGFFLTNDGETLYLYDDQGNLVDSLSYSSNDVIENKSIGRYPDGSFDIKVLTELSPGTNNIYDQEILDDCDIEVNVETESSFLNDMDFKVLISKIFGTGKFNVTLEREIINSNLNIAKKYEDLVIDSILNHRTLSYSPNLIKGDAYLIKVSLKEITCDDVNEKNNYYEKLVYIKKNEIIKNDSSLEIEKISSNEVKFGDIVKVDLNIYRGNTRKYAIKLWVENGKRISDILTLHTKEKFTNYEMQIPIKLYDNCEKKYKDGNYKIMLEGLDESMDKEIKVSGMNEKDCKIIKNETKVIKTEKSKTESKTLSQNLNKENKDSESVINSSEVSGQVIYENSSEKAMGSAIYFFAFVLVLVIIGLILRKNE